MDMVFRWGECWVIPQLPSECFVFLLNLCTTPTPDAALTVAIDGEGRPGGGDLVVADLAVLRRAVLVGGLHLQDAVINLALCHRRPVLVLPEHWGKLIHIVDLNVHHRPAKPDTGMDWSGSAFFILQQTTAINRHNPGRNGLKGLVPLWSSASPTPDCTPVS